MEPSPSPDSGSNVEPFDLAAWVEHDLPDLLDVEADAGAWHYGTGHAPRPVTALTAEDSPLTTFLRSDDMPPEDANRAERAEFYAARDAARDAAVEAARNAAQDHARWAELQGRRRVADAFDAALSRVEQRRQERENGSTSTPVRDADQPTITGRW